MAQLVGAARLETVNFQEFEARRLAIRHSLEGDTIFPVVSAHHGCKAFPSKRAFDIQVTAELRGMSNDGETELLKASCKLELHYEVTDEFKGELSDSVVEMFGRTNGVYNAWPYIREAFQSLTVRLGLPPFTLPLMRLVSGQLESSAEDAAASGE